MDWFTKNKLASWTIILLVVLNIGTISLLWMREFERTRPPSSRQRDWQNSGKERALGFLRGELDLSSEQEQKFGAMRKKHFESMLVIETSIHSLKNDLMDELFKTEPDTEIASQLSLQLGERQAEKEWLVFKHFDEMKANLNPDQQDKFQELVGNILKRERPPDTKFRYRDKFKHRRFPGKRTRPGRGFRSDSL